MLVCALCFVLFPNNSIYALNWNVVIKLKFQQHTERDAKEKIQQKLTDASQINEKRRWFRLSANRLHYNSILIDKNKFNSKNLFDINNSNQIQLTRFDFWDHGYLEDEWAVRRKKEALRKMDVKVSWHYTKCACLTFSRNVSIQHF